MPADTTSEIPIAFDCKRCGQTHDLDYYLPTECLRARVVAAIEAEARNVREWQDAIVEWEAKHAEVIRYRDAMEARAEAAEAEREAMDSIAKAIRRVAAARSVLWVAMADPGADEHGPSREVECAEDALDAAMERAIDAMIAPPVQVHDARPL
jgi:hypothetical protein